METSPVTNAILTVAGACVVRLAYSAFGREAYTNLDTSIDTALMIYLAFVAIYIGVAVYRGMSDPGNHKQL